MSTLLSTALTFLALIPSAHTGAAPAAGGPTVEASAGFVHATQYYHRDGSLPTRPSRLRGYRPWTCTVRAHRQVIACSTSRTTIAIKATASYAGLPHEAWGQVTVIPNPIRR